MTAHGPLTGRTALVTGAARRVGRSIARRLAESGAAIIIHYNTSATEAAEFEAELLKVSPEVHTVQANLEDADSILEMVDGLRIADHRVDILVNSASVYFPTEIGHVDAATWNRIQNINLRAPFLLSQSLGLQMKTRGFGRIINIADCNTRRPYRQFAPYLASKAALACLTEALALEFAPEVTVNAVSPGTVLPPDDAGDAYREAAIKRTPLKRAGSPDDIANMVAYLCEHGEFITGSNFTIDGGATIR
jgi:pteridine reductase